LKNIQLPKAVVFLTIMTVELVDKIPAIRKVLGKGLPVSMRKAPAEEDRESQIQEEHSMTERELKREVRRLHGAIEKVGKILAVSGLEGKVSLGTDVEEIRWDLMGANTAGYFRPEFEFQPEDITDFYIKYETGQQGGYHGLVIRLKRNDRHWSTISANAFNRKSDNYISPSTHISCQAPQAQVAAARHVREGLCSHPINKEGKADSFAKKINELGLVTEVASFTIASLEVIAKQVDPHAEI